MSDQFMTARDALFDLHQKLCHLGLETMKKKNADYAKEDPLGNFFVSEALQACPAEIGILIRMSDKLSRLVSVLSKGKAEVKDESVEDTIVDIINYAVLLRAVTLRKMDKFIIPKDSKTFGSMLVTSEDIERIRKVAGLPGFEL